jgi:hypothetical protein
MPNARETRAIRNPESCYQEWKSENPSAFWLAFERLTLNNLREDSNVRKPCHAGVLRAALESHSAVNSLPQFKQVWPSVCAYDGINTTEDYARVRRTSPEAAASRWTSLTCECRLWGGGRMHHARFLRVPYTTVEVRCAIRLKYPVYVFRERREELYSPRTLRGGRRVRPRRGRRQGADAAFRRAPVGCRNFRRGPMQPVGVAGVSSGGIS